MVAMSVNSPFSSLSFKSTVSDPAAAAAASSAAATAATAAAGSAQDPRFYEKYTFEKDFMMSSPKSMYTVPEGGFVAVDAAELERYLPEGMSSKAEEGLNVGVTGTGAASQKGQQQAERRVWMVRESSKMLCRLVDEYDVHLQGRSEAIKAASSVRVSEIAHQRRVHVPQLTDREEWADNVLKVTRYGADLVNASVEPLQGKTNYVRVHQKEDCAVDSAVDGIRAAMRAESERFPDREISFPDKVMLTGGRGGGKSTVLTQAVLHARRNGWLVVHIPRGWEQTCEGAYVEPAVVPLPAQIVSNGDLDILTSMDTILKPSVQNPLYYAAHSQLVDGQVPEERRGDSPGQRQEQVFDNVFQSAVALRGLHRAHAQQLREIPLSYSTSNDNSAHFRRLRDSLEGVLPVNGRSTGEGDGQVYSSVDALQLLREQFLAAQEKVLSAPGRANFSFLQLRELVEGDDSFADQDKLDAPILNATNGSGAPAAGSGGFDMRSFEFKTLEDLLLFGLAVRSSAGSVFMHLIEELKLLGGEGQAPSPHKVMFAVDQYNCFDAPSSYRWNKRVIMGRDLCVPRALYGLSKKRGVTDAYRINNGMLLCATSHTHEEGRDISYYDAIKSIPVAIRVPNYNQAEYLAAMRYFASLPSRMTEFVTLNQLLNYRALCASNPYEVRLNCFLYFAALGMNDNIDMDSFHYLLPAAGDSAAAVDEKRTALRELDAKFGDFRKTFKGI